MAYKGDTWFRYRGKPTYRRFFIRGAFESSMKHKELWEEVIYDKLDDKNLWVFDIDTTHSTQLSRYSIGLRTRRRYGKYGSGYVVVTIGLYRDGFHIKFDSEGTSRIDMSKAIFDDPNRTSLWTKEAERVAPMTNELMKRIEEYYEK
jgi:hypothetical protein